MICTAMLLITCGSLLSALAALGILRFPDIYTRLHASSKAGPLGAGLVLIGVAFASGDWAVAFRCLLGCAFLIVTSPVSAHLLARAAHRAGTIPDTQTSIDEYRASH